MSVVSTSPRLARPFPDEAAIRCRSGTVALKGKLSEQASISFRHALSLNPMLWEAFEGLCALGMSDSFTVCKSVLPTTLTRQIRYPKLIPYSLLDLRPSNERHPRSLHQNQFQSPLVLDSLHLIPGMRATYLEHGSLKFLHPNSSEWVHPTVQREFSFASASPREYHNFNISAEPSTIRHSTLPMLHFYTLLLNLNL